MQTGTEDYDSYIARGRGDDFQRVIELMDYRMAEAPGSPDDEIRAGALQRRIYDFPMVWTAHNIAHFLGGKFDGKRDQHQTDQFSGHRDSLGELLSNETTGHEPVGTHIDAGGVDVSNADSF